MMRDHSTIKELFASVARELKDSPAASLALANLPGLSVHANIGLGPGAYLLNSVASRTDHATLQRLTYDLYEQINIIPCGMSVTRPDTYSTLLT
jgi:hypothetical protein